MLVDQSMFDFDQIQYQTKAINELTHLIKTKKIPNALLFSGNSDIGRSKAAFLFAKGVNCLNGKLPFCNKCKSCRKIDAKSHPDILTIQLLENKKSILISQIRELKSVILSRPNEAKFRMILIFDADLMNIEAQNALLKMLEEPPERTFFILIAQKISLLAATILSRCRTIMFKPLNYKLVANRLVDEFNFDKDLAKIVSQNADADFKKALSFLQKQELNKQELTWIQKRKFLIEKFLLLMNNNSHKNTQDKLILSESISNETLKIDEAIAIMKTLLRDLIVIKYNSEHVINLDFFDKIQKISHTLETKKIFKYIEELFETEKRLLSNSSIRLTLERFFLRLMAISKRKLYA